MLARVFNVLLISFEYFHKLRVVLSTHAFLNASAITQNILAVLEFSSEQENQCNVKIDDGNDNSISTTCENLSFSLLDIFPLKLNTGRVFNYGAFTYEPYVNLELGHGIELHMILEYCNKYDLICNLTKSDCKWGEIYGNASDSGILKWVNTGEVDVGLGGFYLLGRKLNFVDVVGPSIKIGNTCLVPKPSLSVNIFTIVKSFSKLVWVIIGLTLLTFAILISRILRYKQRYKSIVTTFFVITIFLQQSTKKTLLPTEAHIRYIFILYIFFAIVISASYTSQLYSLFSKPSYENIIKTVKDLDESNYEWGAPHISYTEALQSSPSYSHLLENFVVIENEIELVERFFRGKFGLLVEHSDFGYILKANMNAHNLVEFTTMNEDLYWVYGGLIVTKHSVFYDTLQMHVLYIIASGLQLHWEQESFLESNFNAQLALHLNEVNKHYPLSMEHVQGIFLVLFIGVFLSSIVFGYELWHYNYRRHKLLIVYQ